MKNEREWFQKYLPVNEGVLRRGLYVTSVGCQHTAPGQSFPPKRHPQVYDFRWEQGRVLPEFAIVLFTNGQGEFESKIAGKQTIGPNSVVLLTPGQWHRYHPLPEIGFTERWICFNGEIPHDLMDRGLLDPTDTVMKVVQPVELIRPFDDFLDYVHHQPGINSIVLTHYTFSLLSHMLILTERPHCYDTSLITADGIVPEDPLVKQAVELIWNYSHSVLSINDLLSILPTSRRTLERRFQSVMGRNILDEINNCRISRAKHLLAETDLIMKRIAYLSGFASPDHMRLTFSKKMKLTPTQYRKKNRK